MDTMYIGAEDKREVNDILGYMAEMGYLNFWDEDTIKGVCIEDVDFENAYIRNYGDIQMVFDKAGFRGRKIFAVEVGD